MQKPKLIIFDCDGVLVDSEAISARILVLELAKCDISVSEEEVFNQFVGRSLKDVARSLQISPTSDVFDKLNATYHATLLAALASELEAMSGVSDVISQLDIAFCVATSSSRERTLKSLELSKLDGFFDQNVFTASQVNNGKPAPDLFLFAASEMGVTADACLVIEDSFPGVQAAQAAQMRVWRFTGGAHFAKMRPPFTESAPPVPTFDTWQRFFELAPELKAC
jgi:HAD superfamily hydrolase (TIGR01509 family)